MDIEEQRYSGAAYEVRFANGASLMLAPGQADGFSAAADAAVEGLLGCLPDGTRGDQVVGIVGVRRVDAARCYLCCRPMRSSELVPVEPVAGSAVSVCWACGGEVAHAIVTAHKNGASPFPDVPPDAERDIVRCENVLKHLGLNELRLMACLDIIVRRWKKQFRTDALEEKAYGKERP